MSVIANLDVNVRGNTASLDTALSKSGQTVSTFATAVSGQVAGLGAKLAAIGGGIRASIAGALSGVPNGGALTKMLGAIAAPLSTIKQLGAGVFKTLRGVFTLSPTRVLAGLLDLGNVLSNITKSTVALGAAFVGMGMANIGNVAQLSKESSKLGMSVEALSGFLHATKLDLETFSDRMLKVQKHVAEAAHGNKEAAATFSRLGVDVSEMLKGDPDKMLGKIADGFARVGSQAEQVAVNMELFGRGGGDMLRLMRGGSEGLKKAMEEAADLGLIVTHEQAMQAAAAKSAMSQMKEAFTGLGRTAAIAISPFVKGIADGITEGIKWLNSFREPVLNWFRWMEFGMKNFSEVWDLYFDKMLASMATWFNDVGFYLTRKLPDLVATSIMLFSAEVTNKLTEAFGKGFAEFMGVPEHIDVDKIRREAMAEINARTRAKTDIEKSLDEVANAKEKRINQAWQRFQNGDILPHVHLGGTQASPGTGKNAAVERGSKEAFEIIAGVQNDKMYTAINESIRVQREQLKELQEIRRKKQKGIGVASL